MVEKKSIKWGNIDKSIQNYEGWEWVRQDIVEVEGVLDKKEARKLFGKLQEKINPFIHYDCFKAIRNGGSIVKIAHFPIYIPPKPKSLQGYVNGHVKDKLKQKWFRNLPILQNKHQTENPTPNEWIEAVNKLNIAYAKWVISKDNSVLASLAQWRTLIKREWDRIKNGCWFLIKGEPRFICGSYYFFLTYWGNKEGTGNDYIESDLSEFLHAEAVIKTKGVKGRLEFCRRQDGKSTRHFCLTYWNILITQLIGIIQGKSENDTEKDFGKHYTPKMAVLPFIFKPHKQSELRNILGLKNNHWKDSPLDNSVKVNILKISFQGTLSKSVGGQLFGLKPNEAAGDGETAVIAYIDEFGKMLLVDIVVRYGILVPACSKIFKTTTVEYITPKVMPQCKELAEGSDYRGADIALRHEYDCKELATSVLFLDWCFSNTSDSIIECFSKDKIYAPIFSGLQGKITINGMVQYIKPSWYCFVDRADGINFIDEWGQSNNDDSYAYLKRERTTLHNFGTTTGNMAAYRSYTRKYFFNFDEALGDDSTDSLFDLVAINDQIKRIEDAKAYGRGYIEITEKEFYLGELEGDTHTPAARNKLSEIEKMIGTVKIPLYQRYRLEWTNGPFSPVEFIPDKNGVHEISEFPDVLNNVKWEDGVNSGLKNKEDGYTPKNTDHTGGIDSIDFNTDDLTGKSKPSDFCLYIKASKRCVRETNNRPVYRLKFRPRDPEEAYMEAIKALWLFGCSAGFENGKEAFKTWAKKIDCIKFISLAVTIDTTQNPNKKQLRFRGNTNTGKDKEINFLNLAHYVAYYVNRITDLALLKSLKGLTYKNLTKKDDCAAAMQAETTDKNPSKLSVSMGNRKTQKPFDFYASFKARL